MQLSFGVNTPVSATFCALFTFAILNTQMSKAQTSTIKFQRNILSFMREPKGLGAVHHADMRVLTLCWW